jgi:hypothetical protein
VGQLDVKTSRQAGHLDVQMILVGQLDVTVGQLDVTNGTVGRDNICRNHCGTATSEPFQWGY